MFLSLYNIDSDQNHDPICKLSVGEHTIGRGPLLKCNDKRVSRNHALITINNNGATIISTHQNPCFYQSAISNTIVILERDSPVTLCNGDKFGLFPDQFWFKTQIVSESHTSQADTSHNVSVESNDSVDLLQATVSNKRSHEDIDSEPANKMQKIGNSFVQEEASLELKLEEKVPETQEAEPDNVGQAVFVTNLVDNVQSPAAQVNGIDDLDNPSTSADSTKNELELKHKEEAAEELLAEVLTDLLVDNQVENMLLSVIEVSEVDDGDEPPANAVTAGNALENAQQPAGVDNKDDASTSVDTAGGSKKTYRERCRYGANCFRKNPAHKQEFSHPSDADYASDPDDARPICIYGPLCYRRNKVHLQQYKHPTSLMPKKRKRTAANPRRVDNDTPEDDYDFDDPFLDDDSEDDYEESWSEESDTDWKDSENMDEEAKTLVKEAKRFTRK